MHYVMMKVMGLSGRAPFGGDTTNTEENVCSQCHKTTEQIGSKTLKKCKRCRQKEHKKVCGKKI
jgi:hypothetical protein